MLGLSGAFLLILVNPFLIYYTGIDWLQGWYQSLGIGRLWFVSPLEGLESILVSKQVYLPALIGMAGPILVALLLGRVFCSWVCPISFLTEMLDRLRRLVGRSKYLRDRLVFARQLLWYALIGELFITMVLGAPLFVFISPPGLVGREIMTAVFFHKAAVEGVVVLLVLALELLTRRMYCRYFCPLGGLLALIGTRRKMVVVQDEESCLQCGRCDQACPMGISPARGEALTAYCWNCGACIDACVPGALDFHWRSANPNPVPAGSLPGKS
jgi:ferredoxin-type protein NapH